MINSDADCGLGDGRQNPVPEAVDGEHQYAVEVELREPGSQDVPERLTANAVAGLAPRAIERVLHLRGVSGHHQIDQERLRAGLGHELLLTIATRPEAGAPELPLQHVHELTMVQET